MTENLDSEIDQLAQQMGEDWDRRVRHDYRFWMSDGHKDDQEMWLTGERDLNILLAGLTPNSAQTFLELGCGVGRLLKPASQRFAKVIGLDVSSEAISKARELLSSEISLSQPDKLELLVGNGKDLAQIASGSVDVAVSFAAISSIPTPVVANYLLELNRVVKPGGKLRLQLYVGSEQPVRKDDTLHLRCYTRENLQAALVCAGFELESISELILPIQVSFKELGIEAVIVALTRTSDASASAEIIAQRLLPGGESSDAPGTLGVDLEYWMSVNYAKELAERGDISKAQETLNYAAQVSQCAAIDVRDLMGKIVKAADRTEQAHAAHGAPGSSEIFELNLSLLKQRFPEAADMLLDAISRSGTQASRRPSDEGPVVWLHGQCLDHPHKPLSAGKTWAEKLLKDPRLADVPHLVVVGLGAGYHIEQILNLNQAQGRTQKVSVIEPSIDVLNQALHSRPAAPWLGRIDQLVVGENSSLPEMQEDFELIVRPQTQAVSDGACNRLRAEFYGKRGLRLLHPSFGVLGPLHGGTLPMVDYVVRGLASLGQRVRPYDVSAFDSGFKQIERFLREPSRKNIMENNYCEMISQMILEATTERPIDVLVCMALAPISQRALLELKRRGVVTVLWFVEDYARFTYWKEYARFYDFVFTIQKDKCIEAVKAAGAGEVHYLPVGCDPIAHHPVELTPSERERFGSPISFMGAGYHNRQQLFAALSDYPLKIWGTEWPTCRPFDKMVQEGGRRLAPEEYVKIFGSSAININLHSSHERDGVDPFGDFLNPRTYELAASGAFQLVDKRSLLAEQFEIGKEVAVFSSLQELKDKIRYYLDRPEERQEMAAKARSRALSEHTYAHRLRKMLSIVYSSRFEALRLREENHPWQRVLQRSKRFPELHSRCDTAFKRGEEPNLDGLISDIVTGHGKLTETEQKLLFLYHVRRQIIRMRQEEQGGRS